MESKTAKMLEAAGSSVRQLHKIASDLEQENQKLKAENEEMKTKVDEAERVLDGHEKAELAQKCASVLFQKNYIDDTQKYASELVKKHSISELRSKLATIQDFSVQERYEGVPVKPQVSPRSKQIANEFKNIINS